MADRTVRLGSQSVDWINFDNKTKQMQVQHFEPHSEQVVPDEVCASWLDKNIPFEYLDAPEIKPEGKKK